MIRHTYQATTYILTHISVFLAVMLLWVLQHMAHLAKYLGALIPDLHSMDTPVYCSVVDNGCTVIMKLYTV